jgi:hypothetical protein
MKIADMPSSKLLMVHALTAVKRIRRASVGAPGRIGIDSPSVGAALTAGTAGLIGAMTGAAGTATETETAGTALTLRRDRT